MMATTTTTTPNDGPNNDSSASSILNNLSLKYCSSNKASRLKLMEIIKNKDLRSAFYDFLCFQFCVENLLCWEAIEKFKHKNGTPPEMYSIAEEIYLLFIRDNSRYEINIYGKQKDRLKETLKKTFILPPSNGAQSDTFPKRRKKLRFRKLISKSNLSSIFSDPNQTAGTTSSANSTSLLHNENHHHHQQNGFISAHPIQPPSSPSKLNLRLDEKEGNSSDDSFVVIFKNGGSSSVRGSIPSNIGEPSGTSGEISDYVEDFDRKSIKFGLLKCCNLFNDIQEELEQMMIENSLHEFLKSKSFKEKCAGIVSI
ncbi:hypothetical protein DLAC_08092 [Tieghemostelium lacteum]|uniref:RGS domain-containing protein n=1 Tax=Tieghemostelium lacteum TaxID=361077 RepID=A0A151ZB56_TIELA|nr:hypothetical protein DLAC_08092 [Tieghemostelium lacteum]|eukprot:KYQ91180.1 hypothetical protein DLAC_08092 [Tieghemostelium lacteum]